MEIVMGSTSASAVHIALAISWIGGMLLFLGAVFAMTGGRQPANRTGFRGRVLTWLSAMGLLMAATALITGGNAAYPLINHNYAAVFVTYSGWLLLAKLMIACVILAIGLRIQFVSLPAFVKNTEEGRSTRNLRRWVVIEGVLTLALIWAGTAVANEHPPNHAVVHNWPYPFRFSIANTWGMGMLDAVISIWGAIVLLTVAGGIALLGRVKDWRVSWRHGFSALLTIAALAVGLYGVAVEAFPETYRPTPVSFKAKSVAHAMTLFAENCVPCHGPQAKGDGILAKTLPKPPVDLLTEPHAGMHTPGDFFHWLTNGVPGTGMPAWGEKFSEEERWDLVNLVHAISRGYQSRIINTRVLRDQPFLAPPGFFFTDRNGNIGMLRDFRGEKAVLLVLFSWPASQERLEQLRLGYSVLHDHKTEVLAVPLTDLTAQQMALLTKDLPFTVVKEEAAEIARTYSLFRRTISHPDLAGQGTVPTHMEFLIDRFGYLRARWIPEFDGSDWNDIDFLTQQVDTLNQEKQILPPPPDSVQESTHDMHMGGMKM